MLKKETHMMRRFLVCIAFLLYCRPVHSGDVISELIEPTYLSQSTITTTINAPGAGYRNCLTDIVIVSTHNITFSILDGGTTDYAVDISTSVSFLPIRTAPYIDKWSKDDPFCITENNPLRFTIINSTGSAAQYKLSYRGQIRKRQ